MGQLPEAVKEYKEALRINPNLAQVHYDLGGALKQLGQTAETTQEYETILKIDPTNNFARNNLARLQAVPKTAPAKK